MSICQAFLEDDSGGDRELVAGEAHCSTALDLIDAGHARRGSAGLTTATQWSGAPLAGTIRFQAGFLVAGLSGKTRIQILPPR